MHFVVDTVSEFTYFQNMLLGLADSLQREYKGRITVFGCAKLSGNPVNRHILRFQKCIFTDKCVGVKRTYLRKLIPLTYSEISGWEHKQGVMLPEDLRSFYSSSNGYMFEWSYTFGENNPEEKVTGKIQINPLEEVIQVYGYDTTNDPGVNMDSERYVLRLAPESKIFELVLIPDRGKVVLVYLYPKYVPTIWLLTTNMNFYYLADDIATYLRMAIAHVGIPNWQLAYTSQGVPQWTENMFRMLIPHLLPLNKSLEKMIRERRQRKDEDYPEVPLNKFDPNLFKLLPRPAAPTQPPPTSPTPEPEKQKQGKKKQQPSQQQSKQSDQPRTRPKFQRKPLYYVKKR